MSDKAATLGNSSSSQASSQASSSHSSRHSSSSELIAAGFSSLVGTPVLTHGQYTEAQRREATPTGSCTQLDINCLFEHSYVTGPVGEREEEEIEVYVKTLTGRSYTVRVSRGNTVSDLKGKFQVAEGTPADQQRLVFRGTQLEDSGSLEQYGIDTYSTVHLVLRVQSGSPVAYCLDDSLVMDSGFDFDFTNVTDDGTKFFRGGYEYRRPYGWKRYALKVKGRFEDDTWLGIPGTRRTESSPGEWPVSYHGTALNATGSLAEDGYRLTVGRSFRYTRGIYSTPSIDIAANYALTFEVDRRRYQMVFQNRVNPDTLLVLPEQQAAGGGQFWVSPQQEDVRPYSICVRQIT